MNRPSQNDPNNFLVNSIFENYFSELASKYIKGKLVDIGCGIKPYKEMLSHLVTEDIGVDHEIKVHDTSYIDLFGTAYNMCSNTWKNPSRQKMLLCVKKDDYAIYSGPFIWQLHEEPRDFFRYSK